MSHQSHKDIANFTWSICSLLRGPYKRNEYRKVILPLTVLFSFSALCQAEILTEAGKEWAKEYAEMQVVEMSLDDFNKAVAPKLTDRNNLPPQFKYNFMSIAGDNHNLYMIMYRPALSHRLENASTSRKIDERIILKSFEGYPHSGYKKPKVCAVLNTNMRSNRLYFTGEFYDHNSLSVPLFIREPNESNRYVWDVPSWVRNHKPTRPFVVCVDMEGEVVCTGCRKGWQEYKDAGGWDRKSRCPICLGKGRYPGIKPTFYKIKINYPESDKTAESGDGEANA